MTPILPIDKLYSTGVVVADLESATLRHAEIFGVDHWEVREFTADRLKAVRAYGRPAAATFRTATGTTPGGTVAFELVQPLTGESPFTTFRANRKTGVSHLTLAVRDPDEWAGLRRDLAAHGLRIAASMTVDGRLDRHFIDTREALGGFWVEVQVPLDGSTEPPAADAHWDHSGRYQRPDGIGPIPVQGVGHFGIVVHDMPRRIEQYHRILGVPKWGVRTWRSEPGMLESPYYRGETVDHEYFTALSQSHGFGFEIIQPTFGPSHYNRDFLDQTGEGIHHILLTVLTAPENWEQSVAWLESLGAPRVMGADMAGGAASFCYFDTGPQLGGYVLEAVILNRPPDKPPSSDYDIDFDTVESEDGSDQ
ncbi:Glyoxalase/bleomycin resistance protein/dioxygenase superfamily protein [Frankia sp. Hr75.2]|nr:Glyoxalase/bleomycin resistance protein/dioxygenase superfamily protein [Frankia sp. Hr75.2]